MRKTPIKKPQANNNIIALDIGYTLVKGACENGTFDFSTPGKKLHKDRFGLLNFFRRLTSKSTATDITYRDAKTGARYVMSADKATKPGMIEKFNRDRYVACFRTGIARALWNNPDAYNNMHITINPPSVRMIKDDSWYRAIEGRHRFSITVGKQTKTFDFRVWPGDVKMVCPYTNTGFTY